MKKFDLTEGNENVLYTITLMMIGCMIGFIIFSILTFFKLFEVGITIQLALLAIGLVAGLIIDIKEKRFFKHNS